MYKQLIQGINKKLRRNESNYTRSMCALCIERQSRQISHQCREDWRAWTLKLEVRQRHDAEVVGGGVPMPMPDGHELTRLDRRPQNTIKMLANVRSKVPRPGSGYRMDKKTETAKAQLILHEDTYLRTRLVPVLSP